MTCVTIQDLRAVRYCHAGVRPWFRRHGFDWQDFLAHGIDAERLRPTDDALIEPVIRAAEVRYAAELRGAAKIEAPDGRA
jgi:acyl-CoA thioesterase FadM